MVFRHTVTGAGLGRGGAGAARLRSLWVQGRISQIPAWAGRV